MQKNLVITLTGRDRVGIVEQITGLVLAHHGNVNGSRMARLGGEFALLTMVTVPAESFTDFREAVRGLRDQGYKVATVETQRRDPGKYAGWMPYHVELKGADHEGILHSITRLLAKLGINIESLETNRMQAPMSGIPLFMMDAIVVAPPSIKFHEWLDELEDLGDQLNVEIEVSPYTG